MKRSIHYFSLFAMLLAVTLLALPATSQAGAEWVAIEGVSLNTSLSLADNLNALKGKTVDVNLTSGGNVSGTVVSVGAASLHLSKVVGREAYDALIPLDKIAAVQVRFRTMERK